MHHLILSKPTVQWDDLMTGRLPGNDNTIMVKSENSLIGWIWEWVRALNCYFRYPFVLELLSFDYWISIFMKIDDILSTLLKVRFLVFSYWLQNCGYFTKECTLIHFLSGSSNMVQTKKKLKIEMFLHLCAEKSW